MAANITQATSSGDLVDLVSSSGSATVYPNDDSILSVLQSRFRSDLPYTRIGATHLVVVNPYKTLASLNEVSAHEYEERCYKDTSLPMANSPRPLQPHVYDLAARIYLSMRRRNEHQALVSRGITGSGKSSSTRLVIDQILRLSAHKKKEKKIAEQIKALHQVLDSFGNAKTVVNPNASRHGRYIELLFNERGGIAGAKALTFGLDKRRLNRLSHEERTYHIFYQFLAGATTHERDALNLEDPSDYALLASSNCYRLPAGPFSDDGIAMDDLRASLKILGFKQKHIASIFSLLVAILLLGNIQFVESDFHDVSAHVANIPVLEQAARLLGVGPDELSQALTNKTNYVRRELYTSLLGAEQSAAQRDTLMRDLYAILFAFVVETANHKLVPADGYSSPQISFLDVPGFQNKGSHGTSSIAMYGQSPLVSAYGQNGFEEFAINFADELVHSYIVRNTFDTNVGYNSQMIADAVSLPTIAVMDNSACVELLRGAQLSERAHRKSGGLLGTFSRACSAYKSGKGSEQRNEDVVQDLVTRFGVHASFVASPSVGGAQDRNLFGINHYSGPCTYDASHFVEQDSDLLDSQFVTLLRNSTEPFVAKLVSGPGLAAEPHAVDEHIIVQAQVSSRPLRVSTLDVANDESPRLDPSKTYPITTQINFVMSELFATLDRSRLWNLSCIRPNDSGSSNSFDKRRVKMQIRSLLLSSIASRKTVDFVADFLLEEFCERYVPRMQGSDIERITQCARSNGWKEGVDFFVGHRSVWLSYSAWKMAEDVLRSAERQGEVEDDDVSAYPDDATDYTHPEGGAFYDDSTANYLLARNNVQSQPPMYGAGGLHTPEIGKSFSDVNEGVWGSEWDKKGGSAPGGLSKEGENIVVKEVGNAVEEVPSTRTRRVWLWITWGCTWYIPTYFLKALGRMKRPDIRLAWREKYTIFWLIFLMNGLVIFYIIGLGKLLCPQFDKAWLAKEVATHTTENDWWAAVQGRVYDLTNFVHGDHSAQLVGLPSNGLDTLDTLAGQDLTYFFPVPLRRGCQGLVQSPDVFVTPKNFTLTAQAAMHVSGPRSNYPSTPLFDELWYERTFNEKMKKYYKGPLVWSMKEIKERARSQEDPKIWAVYEKEVFDLTDYFHSLSLNPADPNYDYLNTDITDLIKERSGQDITEPLKPILAKLPLDVVNANIVCMQNAFKVGMVDFRDTPRCLVSNYLLVVFSAILMASMVLKFLAALQLGSKRTPELQDKFVICQVPCYTEGEDSLRRTIDSLTALEYDDKRKLIFIICDGNIIGSGNDRPTPRIVLDILGIDPKLDPEPLLFKSIGEGSKALNYAKVYSGLYEYQGHVVPYMVVVKVGKPTERSKPGNRGKRDSQILLMHYLNRVHFDAPMSPLELEIYHQMRNVIGIDPAFYEYLFTVDADTSVTPGSLNRLVASCADDSQIIGICGETKLENPEGSWWTMIQVYEYYISHHLSKAFESLFGSVTCLPGCFSLYRIRTSDKGRPIIISGRIIDEYAEPNVDTLHKKNLFSLGEDRFLTTLMMKHFPTFKTKFTPDAVAHTVAPDSFRVLFSQRRRWINSTVHNLCELVMLPELFGFCCFSMRFFVFIDLLSTIILPSTVVYIVYLIIVVSSGRAALPILSLVMIGVVYGLQAIIFIIKREFMLVGWMVVYIISYPIYSFFLPVYSFWCMDEFGWGNTRLVIGEGKDKKIVVNDDDKFDDSMIPLKKFSEYEAEAWETGSRHSEETGYLGKSSTKPPRSRGPGSARQESPPDSDYYRNTNVLQPKPSHSNLRGAGGSQASHSSQPANPFASAPHLPMMAFGASQPGSDYGGATGSMMQIPMMAPMNTGSVYGLGIPTQMMTPMGVMNTGGSFGSQFGPGFTGMAPPTMPAAQNRMSTYSLATTVNPFAAGPSQNPNPSDDELFNALRVYLSTQDLMTVTKKTAREAIASRFPKADLTGRKDFLNQSIDQILSGS